MAALSDSERATFVFLFLFILGIAWIIFTSVRSYRKLRHIPGPPLAAVSQLWLFNATAGGDFYLTAEKMLRKYGSPARIGPNMILHSDPEILRYIAIPKSGFTRSDWFASVQFDSRIDNLLSERDEVRHSSLRAKMAPGYTGKEVEAIEARINQRVLDFVSLIQKYIASNAAFDFAEKTQYFTLDSLTDVAFGSPFGFLTKDEDLYEYNKTSTQFFPVLELASNIPVVWKFISSRLMQAIAGPNPEDRTGFGAITKVAQKIVADKFNSRDEKDSSGGLAMIDSFIKHGLTQLEAESESLLQILAGSDSTATSIRMCVLCLLTNPAAYSKLRAEIDHAIAGGQVSYPVITNAEAQRLRYLQAVIKEGLRCWYPLNGTNYMKSPEQGVTINNVYIPPNTQVSVSRHAMLRREDIFGDDADMFNPERWFQPNAERIKQMNGVMDIYFGLGRYSCLGRGIAMMELNKVIFELLKRFDFGLVNPMSTVKSRCYQIHVQKDMMVRASNRATE